MDGKKTADEEEGKIFYGFSKVKLIFRNEKPKPDLAALAVHSIFLLEERNR
jgi:hypothetical protein